METSIRYGNRNCVSFCGRFFASKLKDINVYFIQCCPKFIILAVDSKSIIISIKKEEGNRRERRYTSSQCPELQILDSADLINYPRAPLNSLWFNHKVTSERSSSGREGSQSPSSRLSSRGASLRKEPLC